MLYAVIVLFALAAVLGLVNIKNWLSDKDAPKAAIYIHGLFAATALVLLGIYSFQNPDHYPLAAVVLFLIAAVGGFYLFFTNMVRKTRPVGIAVIHALLAVTGFVVLLFFAFK